MSPDGKHIAFLGITEGFNPDVYISRPDGGGLVRVTTTPRIHDYLPDKGSLGWSPDSSHVVFSAEKITSYPQTTSWIETARADGTDLRRIVQGVKPVYSPNGRTLVYEGIHPGWFRRNLATGASMPLTLSQSSRADIDTWQPRPGQRRPHVRVWVTDRHHPFDGTAHVATTPARAGDEAIFHVYRNDDGHWAQVEAPFHAVTNALGRPLPRTHLQVPRPVPRHRERPRRRRLPARSRFDNVSLQVPQPIAPPTVVSVRRGHGVGR
jgi:hypothetical protein